MHRSIFILAIFFGNCFAAPTKKCTNPAFKKENAENLDPIEVLIDQIDLGPLKILGKLAQAESFGNRTEIYKSAMTVDFYYTGGQMYHTHAFNRYMADMIKIANSQHLDKAPTGEMMVKLQQIMEGKKEEIRGGIEKEGEQKYMLKKQFGDYLADLKQKLKEINALIQIEKNKQ